MIGQSLLHYNIVAKLGEGGMGEVYRAEDTTLDREVALKVLPADLAADPERLARFEREAKTLAALDHPNIVHIFSVEEAEGVPFLTMQLVEGRSVDELIPSQGMSLERIFEVAIPLTEALATAHDKGIVHRDLKPANVMVTSEDRVKVLDFGLAKLSEAKLSQEGMAAGTNEMATEALTGEGRILGTMPYMSPEQLEGRDLDLRSDIFSLGIMLYEMATGARPFQGDTSVSVISSIVKDTPPSVDTVRAELPHHLARIVNRCLEKSPKRRYQSAMDVYNELETLRREVEAGVVSSGVRQPTSAEMQAAKTSPRRLWIIAIGCGVAVVALLAFLMAREGPEGAPDAAVAAKTVESASERLPTLAVLPFQNRGTSEDDFFADGMSEEITTRLAGVSGLRVISSTSAMQYKDNRPSLQQIADELGVDYVVDGSVRWARGAQGSRVRITPQLIRVGDDTQVWAHSYDRVIEDVFEIQSEIAAQVVAELGVTLLEPERKELASKPTENLEAYQAYLRGKHHQELPDFSRSNRDEVLESLGRAVALDPSFGLAHAALAHEHSFYYRLGYDQTEARSAMAREAFDRALALDPRAPRVLYETGYYHYYVEQDYEAALEKFLAAAEATPNDAEVIAATAYVWRRQGRFEEGIERLQRAFELDPRNAQLPALIGEFRMMIRDYSRAVQSFDTAVALAPDEHWPLVQKAQTTWLSTGDLVGAAEILDLVPTSARGSIMYTLHLSDLERLQRRPEKILALHQQATSDWYDHQHVAVPRQLLVAEALLLMGENEAAQKEFQAGLVEVRAELEERPRDFRLHASLGFALAGLGKREEAIAAGEMAQSLLPIDTDAYIGPILIGNLALIYARTGEPDLAIEELDRVLSIPWKISIQEVLLDPRWDSLRGRPGFQDLIDKHS